MRKPKTRSADALQADLDREREISHILTLAILWPADANYRHREGRNLYRWKAYRLTGPAGGYVVATFDCPTNRRPSLHYVARLDKARDEASARAGYEDGIAEAVNHFLTARDGMIEREYGV